MFWFFGGEGSGISVPWPGTELAPTALEADHWMAREIPPCTFPQLYPGIRRVPKNLIWFPCRAMTTDNAEGLRVCTLKALWPQHRISLFWSSDLAERLSLGLQDWVSELGLSLIEVWERRASWLRGDGPFACLLIKEVDKKYTGLKADSGVAFPLNL